MQDAKGQVQALKQEVGDDPGAGTRRVRAARQRAAGEREQRIERAIKAMDELDKSVAGKSKKRHAAVAAQEVAAQEQPEGEQATGQPSK